MDNTVVDNQVIWRTDTLGDNQTATRTDTEADNCTGNLTDTLADNQTVRQKPFWLVEKDGGFTNVGVVIAIALTIALLFTTAQVYWVNSTSGEIQFAADAGALAAENVVAEYYVIARVADAVVLSMSLFGLAIYGIAIVASCIPFAQEIGATLMKFGNNVFKARNDMAKQAQETLVTLQKALPFLAALNAASVISANSFSPSGQAHYQGIALLVPLTGDDIEFSPDETAAKSGKELEEQNEKTNIATEESEAARKEMELAKYQGWLSDCGAKKPSKCMYERAESTAFLNGYSNPYFASVELWEFDYALARAKEYYKKRLAIETPINSKLEEQKKSYIRSLYYAYALEELNKGYVRTDANGEFDAYFPPLASTNAETKKTRLYTDKSFPVDTTGCIHALDVCPGFTGVLVGFGSISDLDAGYYTYCPECDLDINTIGSVASINTNHESGFEHHYREVARAAERYKKASKEYNNLTREAKESATDAFDTFAKALEALKSTRLNINPPGRNGCIVIAFDLSSRPVPKQFMSSFISSGSSLPPRLAISAAALVEDEASEGNSILASFFGRVSPQLEEESSGFSFLGVFSTVFTIWGNLLFVYTQGVDSMVGGVGDFLRSIPIINQTPLASWAERTLAETLEFLGLQGADLSAPKPVIVNSIHVINASDSRALQLLGQSKLAYHSISGEGSGTITNEIFEGLIVEIEQWGNNFLESEFTIYTISFGDIPGLPKIPIKVKLPPAITDRGKSLLSVGLDQLRSIFGGGKSGAIWE